MQKITFEDLPSTNTPINANNLNAIQTNVESAIGDVSTDVLDLQSSISTINESIEKLSQKDIMEIKLLSNYSINATSSYEYINGFGVFNQIGSKLTFANDRITIGAGVKKVLATYHATANAKSGSTNGLYTYLRQISPNLTYPNISQDRINFTSSGGMGQVTLSPQLLEVEEGDEFLLACYGEAGATIVGTSPVKNTFNKTTLTIQVVEYE